MQSSKRFVWDLSVDDYNMAVIASGLEHAME